MRLYDFFLDWIILIADLEIFIALSEVKFKDVTSHKFSLNVMYILAT